jgi:PAS domain S-box-containing protein
MATKTLSRLRHPGAVPVALLLVVLFVALDLMSGAVQNSEELSRAFVPLLFLVLLGLAALVVMVAVNVIKLVGRYRRQAAGSRLTGRIVLLFALISLLPVGVVYYYSLGFLLRGIDSWFDVEIDRAMEDALTLNQASLDLNQRVLLRYTEQLLAGIQDRSTTALALSLGQIRRRAGALEIAVFGPSGQVYGNVSEDPTQLVPDHPDRELFNRVRHGENYVGLESRNSGELVVRVLARDPGNRSMIMQAIFPTSERISELSTKLEDAYNRYTELSYLRQSLKLSFSVTLSLVLLFGLMSALIAAFHTARRLVAPVADIARGTRAVAEGDYEQQLPMPGHDDELAFLVASFNAMTRRIAQARDATARSQQAVEAQRAYLETVLGRLSSGVIAMDMVRVLRTANPAAHHILGLEPEAINGKSIDLLAEEHPRLTNWVETVRAHLDTRQEWRAEVTLFSTEGRQVLMCRGSPLIRPGSGEDGYVVVFDDITTLIMAQRDAAWGEVARRLAHEIKNPLTPIQLSAERLRHKLLAKLPEQEARVVDRSTHTIVQQVEAMKAMVNDFSNYARSPQMEAEPIRLDHLVAEVMDLYRGGPAGGIEVRLGAHEEKIKGDPLRLRQIIHNLVKNAQEAVEGREDARVLVTTVTIEDAERPLLELAVEDNGGGIEEGLLGRLFEPYVTTKAKGTGLGLAIVKKIIEEHGGIIWAENTNGGARVCARLPAWRAESGSRGRRMAASH